MSLVTYEELVDKAKATSSKRYLKAEEVKMPSRAPRFVEEGHCQWCNKPFPEGSRSKFYCPVSPDSRYSNISECALAFYKWWTSRPAYVRATFIHDNFTCQKCGFHKMREDRPWLPDISELECDHIVPISKGGKTTMKNLQTLCIRCNRKKGARKESKDVKTPMLF